jgi:hypothetical protein
MAKAPRTDIPPQPTFWVLPSSEDHDGVRHFHVLKLATESDLSGDGPFIERNDGRLLLVVGGATLF